jgi:hypothetical protein
VVAARFGLPCQKICVTNFQKFYIGEKMKEIKVTLQPEFVEILREQGPQSKDREGQTEGKLLK